jgi:hypothetical protein
MARGVITVSPKNLFWAEDDFSVSQANTIIARCKQAGQECAFTP